jgi:hypothetical protein
MTVLATTMVRRALKAAGVRNEYIFTNKYETCRTVKIYGTGHAAYDARRIAAVEALNIPGLTVKTRVSSRPVFSFYSASPSIIFRLPL